MEGNLPTEEYRKKSEIRVRVNLTLLAMAFTLFTFISALNAQMLRDNVFLALQLTLAIPLIISSIFARSKLTYTKRTKKWSDYGFYTFIIAYTFLINSVGIILSYVISFKIALVFFLLNIGGALMYSMLDISEYKDNIKKRIKKDWIFLVGIVVLGILPSALAA